MLVAEKPELNEDLLIHYGIRGMKWGFRRGSSKTGVSRARGATIDKNNRYIARLQNAQKGKGLFRDRIEMRLAKIQMGESAVKRHAKLQISELRDQNARLKSGKATVRDKLTVLFNTTPVNLILSNRPK